MPKVQNTFLKGNVMKKSPSKLNKGGKVTKLAKKTQMLKDTDVTKMNKGGCAKTKK